MAEGTKTKVETGRTYDFVYGQLIRRGMSYDKAKAYASFCQDIYNYIQDNHDLADGLKHIAIANQLQPMARQLQLTKSVARLKNVRLGGMAGIANVFVDHFKPIAARYGIELDECSLCIAKICLDIGSAGVGAVSTVAGVGWVWLGLSVIATFQDSQDLAKVCLLKS